MRIANNLGKEAKFAATVLGQATVSRHMENMMEASQVFDQTYNEILSQTNPDTGEKFTPEEAKKHASEAASFTYKANWPMIAKDIMQYALLARGTGMSKAIDDVALAKAAGKSAASAALLKGYGVATDLASEGMEEAYQFIVGEEGRHFAKVQAGIEEDGKFRERFGSYLKDGEMWTAALFGALGAGVAHSVKPLINKLQPSDNVSETQSRIDEIKSRSERIAYHAQKLKEAQATGNEDAVKQAKADMAFEMGTRAAKTGNLDLILENLEQIKGMSKEEKEANNFDDSFTENIEEAKRNIEEAATLYSKAAKKYHVATAESIAKLQFENQNLGKSAEEANIKVSEAKSKYPRLADLSAAGNRSLDTQVTIAANDIRIHQLEKLLQDTNISEDEKESYLKLHTNAVADNNKLLEDLKEIHPETTVEDRKILKGIETPLADDLISAKAVEQYTKERIDINTDALLKITSNKFQNGVQAKLDAAAKAKIEEDKLNNSNQAVNTATQEVEAASNPEQSNEGEVPGTPATEEDMDDFLYGLEEEEDGTAAAKPIEIKPTTQQMIEGNQVVSGNIAEELPVPENTTVEKQNSVVSVDEKVDNSSANPFMLTYMSASNSNASLMQQNDTELIELAEFLENPNNPLTQYELELSIDEKFLEENRPLNELGITKTLKAGKELDATQAAH
jgi:uncharacterized protein YaeQ